MSAPMDVSTTVVKDAGLEARSVNVEGGARVELETQTHVVGVITPPPDIRAIVDKTAQFVARNGPEFETRILGSEKNNAKFNFLLPADPYNAYYKSKIAAFKEEAAGGDAAAVAKKAEEARHGECSRSHLHFERGYGGRPAPSSAPKNSYSLK